MAKISAFKTKDSRVYGVFVEKQNLIQKFFDHFFADEFPKSFRFYEDDFGKLRYPDGLPDTGRYVCRFPDGEVTIAFHG